MVELNTNLEGCISESIQTNEHLYSQCRDSTETDVPSNGLCNNFQTPVTQLRYAEIHRSMKNMEMTK